MGEPPLHDKDDLVLYLAELSRRAYNVNPGYPVPLLRGDGVEIGLQFWSDSEGEEGEEDEAQSELSFEDDIGIEQALLCEGTGESRQDDPEEEQERESEGVAPLGELHSL